MPQVDAGLFTMRRRPEPLVDPAERPRFEAMVARVFASPGAGLSSILPAARVLPRPVAKRWLRERSHSAGALSRDLAVADWVDLWSVHRAATRG